MTYDYTVEDVDRVIEEEVVTDYGDSGWSIWHYGEFPDSGVDSELGHIEMIQNSGEREGYDQELIVVLKITNANGTRYFRKDGVYSSFVGTSFDSKTREVQPVDKLVRFYE